MPIDASQVQWDEAPKLDPSQIKWDEPKKEQSYIESRVEAVKDFGRSLVDPETYKNIGRELANFPPVTEETKGQLREKAIDIGTAALPITKVAKSFRSTLKPAKVGAEVIKEQTLATAGKSGYTVPRSNVKETALTNLGERFGGKQAVEATAQIKNQPVTNKLAAKALGLAEDTPITAEVLGDLRAEAGKAYEAVKSIGILSSDKSYTEALRTIRNTYSGASKDFPELANKEVGKLVRGLSKPTISAEGAVEQIKNLRDSAKGNLGMNASASDKLLGRAKLKAAKALEDLVERNIEPTLGSQMLKDYRAARELIAKTYTVERALNPATGNVVGTELAKQAKRGSPLTGELKDIADFSRAFPRLAREPIGAPASGGLFEPLVYGGVAGGVAGPPGIAAAAIPIIGKPLARKAMTTIPRPDAQGIVSKVMETTAGQRGALGVGIQAYREKTEDIRQKKSQVKQSDLPNRQKRRQIESLNQEMGEVFKDARQNLDRDEFRQLRSSVR